MEHWEGKHWEGEHGRGGTLGGEHWEGECARWSIKLVEIKHGLWSMRGYIEHWHDGALGGVEHLMFPSSLFHFLISHHNKVIMHVPSHFHKISMENEIKCPFSSSFPS